MGQHHGRSRADPPDGAAPDGAADGEDLAHALAFTLLLDDRGAKFGKTAAGTSVWLDAERTTPYAFYQYWLANPTTATWAGCCGSFTLLDRPAIEAVEARAGRVAGAAGGAAGAGVRRHGAGPRRGRGAGRGAAVARGRSPAGC